MALTDELEIISVKTKVLVISKTVDAILAGNPIPVFFVSRVIITAERTVYDLIQFKGRRVDYEYEPDYINCRRYDIIEPKNFERLLSHVAEEYKKQVATINKIY